MGWFTEVIMAIALAGIVAFSVATVINLWGE